MRAFTRGTAALGLALVIGPPAPAHAQLARQTLPVDLGSGAIAGTLPFDERRASG